MSSLLMIATRGWRHFYADTRYPIRYNQHDPRQRLYAILHRFDGLYSSLKQCCTYTCVDLHPWHGYLQFKPLGNYMHVATSYSPQPANAPTGLQVRHLSLTDMARLRADNPGTDDDLDALQAGLLGVIAFSPVSLVLPSAIPLQQVYMQTLSETALHADADNTASCEAWYSDSGPMHSFSHALPGGGELRYRHDAQYLFGVVTLPEHSIVAADAAQQAISALQLASETAYRQIFALLDRLGFQQIYRFWNYMADINGVSHGQERYRQFNVGRQDAFLAHNRSLSGQLPAACALGAAAGPLTIAFLAGRDAVNSPVQTMAKPTVLKSAELKSVVLKSTVLKSTVQSIENPRQMSAYEYPEVYGPRSPSFARATLLQVDGSAAGGNLQQVLFISGTASIVGHQTLHAGDVVAQTKETLANLQALIAQARLQGFQANNAKSSKHNLASAGVIYRVYVRHAEDMPRIKAVLRAVVGEDNAANVHAIYLQADVCRSDLLVEIEATLFSCNDPAAA